MRETLVDMVNPAAVIGTIVAAMAIYLMLWTVPEPFSKGIAAAMTIWLLGYFGFDPLWRLAKAWRKLVEEADAALDFEELRRAGERFGERAGPAAARLLILVTTLAIGGGAAGMAGRGPSLPGFSLANAQAEGQLAVSLVTASTAESVLVGAQTVTITFAPGLLAMATASPKPGIQGDTVSRRPSDTPKIFRGDDAVGHFQKHSHELMEALGKKSYNLKQYIADANEVLRSGTWVPELNGYVKLIGGQGSAKAAFVGLTRDGAHITTFHVKPVRELARSAPSLGWTP